MLNGALKYCTKRSYKTTDLWKHCNSLHEAVIYIYIAREREREIYTELISCLVDESTCSTLVRNQ